MKLRTKFAIVLVLVTLVLSGAVYGGLEIYKDRLVEESRDDVDQTARLTAGQLDESVEDRKDFIGFTASRPAASRFNESDRFLREFVGNSRFFAAQIVDDNGTIVDFHGDITQEVQQESIGANVRDRPYVAEALDGAVSVSDPEYVNATGGYLVVFSAPIFDDRELEGVLAASIYLDQQTFFGVLGPISRDDQRVTVTAGSETLYRSGERFDQSIEESATVDATGWTVTIVRDRSGLLSQLRELAIAQGVGLLLVLSSMVVFAIWEYRTTLAQTEKLLDGFIALQAGEFDHELSLAAAEEWEQISQGFNALARSLGDREAELLQREQRLQVLNRVLRHNLRNIAGVVLGYAEVVGERTSDETVRESARSIELAGENLETLSEKARQLELTMEEHESVVIDVPQVVTTVVGDLREEYPAVELTASLPPTAWARADPALRIAIRNVCENACEHAGLPDPRLDVTVEADPDRVAIRMADNGEGIPDYEKVVLYEGQETPLEHSSGLGLWIAQWTVERSGGTLRFATNDEGGTTVIIELRSATPDGSNAPNGDGGDDDEAVGDA